MWEDLKEFNNFGNKKEIGFLLFNALSDSKPLYIDDVIRFCISNIFSISRSVRGSIKLLEFLSIITIEKTTILLNKEYFDKSKFISSEEYFMSTCFLDLLFKKLTEVDVLKNLFNNDTLKFNPGVSQYYVKGNFIPLFLFSFRNLLISIDFLIEEDIAPNNYIINPLFSEFLKTSVIDSLERANHKRIISLEHLKKSLESKEILGKEGEKFVLQYERKRLKTHPHIDTIKIISEEHANAGFDIKSFRSIDSLLIDMFIEVKTYSGNAEFYWTQNEIRIAEELQSDYFIYLVDISSISNPSYSPTVIQNPHEKIIVQELLEKSVDVWKVKL